MMAVPAGVRIHLALGATDMRKGFDGLSLLVQEVLRTDPFSGHRFVFRGRRGDRATLYILPFRNQVAGVSCRLAARCSCSDAD